MLVDAFLYAGEKDLLDLRMCELRDTVDLFIAVEGMLTFQGQPREIDLSLRDIPHLMHLVVSDFPEASERNPWKREMWQRNAMLRALQGLRSDDLVMVSDVDEIPDSALIPIALRPKQVVRFQQELYQFNFNNHVVNDDGAILGWSNTTVCRYDDLCRLYPQGMRNLTESNAEYGLSYIFGGWHFSWCCNPLDKLNSYSHIELKTMQGELSERVQQRWGYRYETVEGTAHLPKCVQDDLERYSKYLKRESYDFADFDLRGAHV